MRNNESIDVTELERIHSKITDIDGVDARMEYESQIEPRKEKKVLKRTDTRVVQKNGCMTTEKVTHEEEKMVIVGEKQILVDAHIEVNANDESIVDEIEIVCEQNNKDVQKSENKYIIS